MCNSQKLALLLKKSYLIYSGTSFYPVHYRPMVLLETWVYGHIKPFLWSEHEERTCEQVPQFSLFFNVKNIMQKTDHWKESYLYSLLGKPLNHHLCVHNLYPAHFHILVDLSVGVTHLKLKCVGIVVQFTFCSNPPCISHWHFYKEASKYTVQRTFKRQL